MTPSDHVSALRCKQTAYKWQADYECRRTLEYGSLKALQREVERGDVFGISCCALRGVDVNVMWPNGSGPALVEAASRGHLQAVIRLLELGADPRVPNAHGYTALMAADAAAKELITETEILIKKLKGEIASHGAEIDQLKKDIAQNEEAVKEATEVRNKEHGEYANERTESENCIAALEHAIKVLTGAGTGKFLDTTTHQVQLLSIAGQMQRVLRQSSGRQSFSSIDLDVVKSFVAKPMEFFHSNAIASVFCFIRSVCDRAFPCS